MVVYLQWKGHVIPWITIIKLICLPLWCLASSLFFTSLPLPRAVNVKTDSEPISLQPSALPSFSLKVVQLASSPSLPHVGHSESIQASISIFTTSRGSCPKSYRCWDSVVPRWVMGV